MRSALILISTFFISGALHADDMQQRIEQSKGVAMAFMTELKTELETAMKAGGPIQAISVCNLKAPEIARHQSDKHKMDVGRTSLKVRNQANAPDAWEKSVLTAFDARQAKGESTDTMAFSEVVNENGKKYFRFMKAIPTGDVCLKCHGSNIEPAVASKLDALYPEDQARGYKWGDIRGAFSIKQSM